MKDSPVLTGVEAPRCARPLRASASTPAARRARFAFAAGLIRYDEMSEGDPTSHR
jgi:hypothetical protein